VLQGAYIKISLLQNHIATYPPIMITLTADALHQESESIVSNRHTNWDDFRRLVNESLTLNIPLKTVDIEAAAKFFNVRFEVFTAVTMKNGVFWVVTSSQRTSVASCSLCCS
jgi:hypothetical protein